MHGILIERVRAGDTGVRARADSSDGGDRREGRSRLGGRSGECDAEAVADDGAVGVVDVARDVSHGAGEVRTAGDAGFL